MSPLLKLNLLPPLRHVPTMSCEARVLGHPSALPGFHTTKSCTQLAKKRLIIAEDPHRSCDECFRRYTTGTDWYGWFDGSFPPQAPVVGSQSFYTSLAKTKVNVTLPSQKAPLGSCGTCSRTSFERSECQVCHTEVCRACASVSPRGDRGDFCRRCVPKLPLPVPKEEPEAPVEPSTLEVEALTAQVAEMSLQEARPQPQAKAKAKPKALDYPIRDDINSLSLHELKALHVPLVAWMKENQTKYPRLIIPYYRYRMKMEALMIQKK